jgi:hypothetical protein
LEYKASFVGKYLGIKHFLYFSFKKGSLVCDLLPPPSNEDAVTSINSRSTKAEDRVGGTGKTGGAARAPPDFSSFSGKTFSSFIRPSVPLSPPRFSDLPPVLEDDLLPVLSPPEGYRDGPLPPPPLLPAQLALRLLPSLPPPLSPLSPLSPEYHHRRSMTQQQRLDNNTCPEEASSSSTSPPQQLHGMENSLLQLSQRLTYAHLSLYLTMEPKSTFLFDIVLPFPVIFTNIFCEIGLLKREFADNQMHFSVSVFNPQ